MKKLLIVPIAMALFGFSPVSDKEAEEAFEICFKCEYCIPDANGVMQCYNCVEIPCGIR